MDKPYLRKQVQKLSETDRIEALTDLLDVLYGVGAPKDMGADQIGAVVNVLHYYGLAPEGG